MKAMRIDKFLVGQGIGSRKEVKEYVAKGLLTVNGHRVKEPEEKIVPGEDEIIFNGQPVLFEEFVYFLLNKPKGCICATEDEKTPTVLDYIKEERHRKLAPVGRLDKDSEGLLLITDDGDLSHQLLSPKHHVEKVYLVTLAKPVREKDRKSFAVGLNIGERKPTLPAKLEALEGSRAMVTICEGKFHQIKRMFEVCNNEVLELKRIAMGELKLGEDLEPGDYRRLTKEELAYVKQCKRRTV